jgi:excinuclease ABC subunit C
MTLHDQVVEKLEALPAQPGVYLFKDKKGAVVYVGKAKSLRSRVRSYFQSGTSDVRPFVALLSRVLGDLETIVTANEKEATILENTLIKEHKPRYNVKLRDDKEYLSLRLAMKDEWPRLDLVRRPASDGARYFGPYHSATAARRTLHLINKHFQLRTCSDMEMQSRKRPCLQYQIKRCPAPCVYEVDEQWYEEQVQNVALFLDGRYKELEKTLTRRMHEAASDMRFELAAVYRDQLRAIEKVQEEQRVVVVDQIDRDVIGLYREGDVIELSLLYVRSGKLADVATFPVKGVEAPDEEVVSAFLAQHYGRTQSADEEEIAVPIPAEILVPALPDGVEGIAELLADQAGHKVAILHPQRGEKADLLALANDNARHAFAEKRRASDDISERLAQLQERLRLPTVPRRIECIDISHLGGGDTVGAIVAMRDGELDKKRYRTFHVRGDSQQAAGDDYGAMYEVLARRFRRARAAQAAAEQAPPTQDADEAAEPESMKLDKPEARKEGEWEAPDLMVVDGGRGQLAVALAAAHDLGLHDLPIVALAKEKENLLGETLVDRVYLPGQKNPIPLKSHSASLFFLARLRDEAHRFSNKGRKKKGKERRLHSALDDIKGIGDKTKKTLLRELGSLQAIAAASDEELLAVPGVNKRHVAALRAALATPTPPSVSSSAPPPSSTPTATS